MKRNILLLICKLVDILGIVLTPIAAVIAKLQSTVGPYRLPLTYSLWDRFGVMPVRYHYYQPIFDVNALPDDTWTRRDPLLGIDLKIPEQLALLSTFDFGSELQSLPMASDGSLQYFYDNASFLSGDSEILYNVIRHFRPKRMIEIGSGLSTRMAKAAFDRNRAEGDQPRHTCIEPFEMPWLEKLGDTEIIRSRVEDVDPSIFQTLGENDILFINSSHVLRLGGDVYIEYLRILPSLPKGVIVHVHDIFWPFDYPRAFVQAKRYFWNEQYLLQAFLAFNSDFHVMLALNYLATDHRRELERACPVFAAQKDRTPGSFWMRRV